MTPRTMSERSYHEATSHSLLKHVMKFGSDIQLDRVHGMGKPRAGASFARPVVAKFERHKDREAVGRAAPRTLARSSIPKKWKVNVLFNDALNTLFTVIWKEGRKCFI